MNDYEVNLVADVRARENMQVLRWVGVWGKKSGLSWKNVEEKVE